QLGGGEEQAGLQEQEEEISQQGPPQNTSTALFDIGHVEVAHGAVVEGDEDHEEGEEDRQSASPEGELTRAGVDDAGDRRGQGNPDRDRVELLEVLDGPILGCVHPSSAGDPSSLVLWEA